MRNTQMLITYRCNCCGFECDNAAEAETHAAKHIGNGLSLEEYYRWEELKRTATTASKLVYSTNNDETRSLFDRHIKELTDFEELHGITP